MIAAALFGGVWAFIPGYLQAKRGSHVVITTIMFNFIAAAIMVYIISRILKPAGIASDEIARIDARHPRAEAARIVSMAAQQRRSISPSSRHCGAGRRLHPDLAHQVRLRHARPRPQPDRRALCRHVEREADHDRDGLSGALAGMVAVNDR